MADITDSKNWSFETRQLHIGQEQADPVTDARAGSHLCYHFLCVPQFAACGGFVLDCGTPGISTEG